MTPVIDPDCLQGKHGACPEWTWDDQYDKAAICDCDCHDPKKETP